MQIRSRSGAPLRAYLNGTASNLIQEHSTTPLLLWTSLELGDGEPSRVYIRGGQIPARHTWEVDMIKYRFQTENDSNQGSFFAITLDGKRLIELGKGDAESGTWTGSVELDARQLRRSYVEVRGATQCDVRFLGTLIPADNATRRALNER